MMDAHVAVIYIGALLFNIVLVNDQVFQAFHNQIDSIMMLVGFCQVLTMVLIHYRTS